MIPACVDSHGQPADLNIYPGYQSSPSAGDAICTFNGTAYKLDGTAFALPQSLLSALEEDAQEPSQSSSSTSAAVETVYVPIPPPAADVDNVPLDTAPPSSTVTASTGTLTMTSDADSSPLPKTTVSVTLMSTAVVKLLVR